MMTRRQFAAGLGAAPVLRGVAKRPNILFILTDDHRFDAIGAAGNPRIHTPAMDSIAQRGVRFSQACVTMSVCSASRAAILTGRYGSQNGVLGLDASLNPGERTISSLLKDAGYFNGYVGKWHLRPPDRPQDAGFHRASWFYANGPHFERKVNEEGREKVAKGFLEDYIATRAISFLEEAARDSRPFFLHYSTQLPHLDHEFRWHARPETLARYDAAKLPLPATWNEDYRGKPAYLRNARNHTQALSYGYDDPTRIRMHNREYYAAITDLDRCIGRVLDSLRRLDLEDNTYVFLMGDNGWFLGEHGFTSKVLPYEESMRVPLLAAGPGVRRRTTEDFVLNIDLFPAFCEIAGVPVPSNTHGRSLLPLLRAEKVRWRDAVYYQALRPELGARPVEALRTREWKYIATLSETDRNKVEFEELYDLRKDPIESSNVAARSPAVVEKCRLRLREYRATLS